MKRPSLKQTACAALSALTLTAAPACAEIRQEPARGLAGLPEPQCLGGAPLPAALSLWAQLDVITSSGILDAELRQRSAHENGEYEFYVAVTDLDYNGRLEVLISRHTLSYEPFVYAGEGLSDKARAALAALCTENPVAVESAAYEVSADGTRLEELTITGESGIAPDFTNFYTKPRTDESGYLYHVYTPRLTPQPTEGDPWCYPISLATQTARLAGGTMHLAWTAESEGTVSIGRDSYERDFTSMEIRATGETIDPRRVPEELRRRDEGDPLPTRAGEAIVRGPRDKLIELWCNWTNQQDILNYARGRFGMGMGSGPQLSGARESLIK